MIKKIILIGLALMMGLGSFSGCTPKPRNIYASSLFSKNILELPIKGILPNAPGYYYIDKTAEEMFSIISLDKSLSTKFIEGKIFISKDNGDDTKDFFIIRELVDADGNRMYLFFDMGGHVRSGKFYQSILMPYHFVSRQEDERTFYIGREYNTKFSVEDFFDYYNDSGWYDVEQEADCIIINGYKDKERVLALNNSLKYPLRNIEFTNPLKIQFENSNEIDVNVFTISLYRKE